MWLIGVFTFVRYTSWKGMRGGELSDAAPSAKISYLLCVPWGLPNASYLKRGKNRTDKKSVLQGVYKTKPDRLADPREKKTKEGEKRGKTPEFTSE